MVLVPQLPVGSMLQDRTKDPSRRRSILLGLLAAFGVSMAVAVISGIVLGFSLTDGNPAPISVQLTDTVLASLMAAAPLTAAGLLIVAWPLDHFLDKLKRTSWIYYVVAGAVISILILALLAIFQDANFFVFVVLRFGWIPIIVTGPAAMLVFWKVTIH